MEEHASVRIAGPADAAAISALLYDFNGEALAPEHLSRRIVEAEGLETAFLAELRGEPVGLLVLRTVPALSEPEDLAEITEIYVRPSARRLGVGGALVEAAFYYARQRGSQEIYLLVDPENRSAQAFYEVLGFCRDSWQMRRAL